MAKNSKRPQLAEPIPLVTAEYAQGAEEHDCDEDQAHDQRDHDDSHDGGEHSSYSKEE